jgi:carbonic anhydrase/acetyltransferase-like protein (isoleucine patch superfamily)
MLFVRNGAAPEVSRDAQIAPTASVVGNVVIGAGAYLDHHVVIASAGPRIEIDEEAIILAGSIIRSVGGTGRPAYGVSVGCGTLIAPNCVLTGCAIGRNCYVATGVTILQGARIGDDGRLGLGAVVHAGTKLPDGAHLGLRHVAVPTCDGYVSSADVDIIRATLNASDFFELAFDERHSDQRELHRAAIARVREEVSSWTDEPLGDGPRA